MEHLAREKKKNAEIFLKKVKLNVAWELIYRNNSKYIRVVYVTKQMRCIFYRKYTNKVVPREIFLPLTKFRLSGNFLFYMKNATVTKKQNI